MRRDSTELDLFDTNAGTFLGTVALRDRVRRLTLRGARLAALVERVQPDIEGLPGIDVYELSE